MAEDKIVEMSCSDFIELAKEHGIMIDAIGSHAVYVIEPADELPNNSDIRLNCTVRQGWTDKSSAPACTLGEAMAGGRKIMAIKIVRANTGMGLKDSKDLVEGNWDAWCRIIPATGDAIAEGLRKHG